MNQMSPIVQAKSDRAAAASLVLQLRDRRPVGEDIEEFTFASADGQLLPPWEPGAHVEFLLPLEGGVEGRSYSLLGDPQDRHIWRIAVLRQADGRGGSVWLHDNARPGLLVPAVGPRHAFNLPDADRYLFVAGGIGITPLLPMIAAVESRGKTWELVYLARHEARFAYASELRALAGGRVVFHTAAAPSFDLAGKLSTLPAGTAVQSCGPAPLLDALEKLASDAAGRWTLSIERFAGPELGAGERSFEVRLARSNRTLVVPADRSLLDTLREAGLKVESSCRAGSCGTCECGVLEGRIDHRDQILTPAERERGNAMMVCVSRAVDGHLVLDL